MTKQVFRGSPLKGDSPLPSLAVFSVAQNNLQSDLPEGDPLYLGYGAVDCFYPYTQQDRYDRELVDMEVDVAVLENDKLKAVFLPTYGGRLWQLWDKVNKRDLLYTNDILRPSNLGLRNAWFAGGVEWNCGMAGHHPFTCAQMFTSTYEADGEPVLRLYQWERVRNVTYQIDFSLPEGSSFLYARTRIHNPNNEIVPMYWWSNTAVPEHEGARVAVPAEDSYVVNDGFVTREPFPIDGNTDISYPMNTKMQKDYFYFIPDETRKYEGYIFSDGTGLIQASTSRLQGRKLFVWGQNLGSETWQRFLTEDAGPYLEIQAGLGRTQYGCVPMQPYGTWEFAEVYGSISIDAGLQKADYPVFRAAVDNALEAAKPEQDLEDWLAATADTMGRNLVPVVSYGSGDAALENQMRVSFGLRELNPGLDFGETGSEQSDFVHLLTYGYMPEHGNDYVPRVFVSGQCWRALLEAAADGPDRDNWLTWYHLGLVLMDERNRTVRCGQHNKDLGAVLALRRAADICANGPVLYALAEALSNIGEAVEAAACAVKACRLFEGDLSVAKDTMRILVSLRACDQALALYDTLPEAVQADGRIEFWRAFALACSDRCDEALAIITRPDFVVADFRESEQSINALWGEIIRRTGEMNMILPDHLNFNSNMSVF